MRKDLDTNCAVDIVKAMLILLLDYVGYLSSACSYQVILCSKSQFLQNRAIMFTLYYDKQANITEIIGLCCLRAHLSLLKIMFNYVQSNHADSSIRHVSTRAQSALTLVLPISLNACFKGSPNYICKRT